MKHKTDTSWRSIILRAYDDCGEPALHTEDIYNYIGTAIEGGKSLVLRHTINRHQLELTSGSNVYVLRLVQNSDYYEVVTNNHVRICARINGLNAELHFTYVKYLL